MIVSTDTSVGNRLELNGLTKIYPSVIANENVSLKCERVRFMQCWVKTVLVKVP